ncbi:hypothetical protein QBC39DRAFT_340728, partial [Podospora conica]
MMTGSGWVTVFFITCILSASSIDIITGLAASGASHAGLCIIWRLEWVRAGGGLGGGDSQGRRVIPPLHVMVWFGFVSLS